MPMFRKKPVVIEARQMPEITLEVMSQYQDMLTPQTGPGSSSFISSAGFKVVEAARTLADIVEWCDGSVTKDALGPCIAIDTLEGTMLARPGDWIIKVAQGEFSISRQAAFLADYEGMSA